MLSWRRVFSPQWLLVAERRLQASAAVARGVSCLAACEISFPTRDQNRVTCMGRWILNHWTARKSLEWILIQPNSFLFVIIVITM